jgi:hypothetical protein
MAGTLITITNAGRAALVTPANDGTNAHKITAIGLATAPFDSSDKTLDALPHELKRIATFAGENVADDTIHVTLKDDTTDQYTLYGFGLYLEDGTLFGVFSQASAVMEKSPAAMLLLSADMQFTSIDAAALTFGDATFTNPPASTERQGVVELATIAEATAGTDDRRAVTPAGMKAAFVPAIANKSDKGHHHPILEIDGLQTALDGKSPIGHGHAIADVSGLQSALDSRLGVSGGTVSGDVRLKSNTAGYSTYLYLDANGYAPFLRSSSVQQRLEIVDSANQNINAHLTEAGVLTLPRARPSWAGLTPWDSGNLPNPYTTAGGVLANNASVQTRTAWGNQAFRVTAPDSQGIGGGWSDWNANRTPALQIDAPAVGSAYMGMRWTRQGGRHLAAIEAYEGGSTTSAPTIVMHVDGQNNAWTIGRTDITRGAGGYVYGTWNLNPYPMSGGSLNGPLSTNYRVQGGDVVSNGYLYSGGGSSYVASDGNLYGTVWGGWLSNWINNNKVPIQGGGAYGYVRNDRGNLVNIPWGSNGLEAWIDGSFQGFILTTNQFTNWAAPRGVIDYDGMYSYIYSKYYNNNNHNPGIAYGTNVTIPGHPGTWQSRSQQSGIDEHLYIRVA